MNPKTNNRMKFLYAGLAVLILVTGFIVYKTLAPSNEPIAEVEDITEVLPEADPSIIVDLKLSKAKANAVILSVSNLASKYASVGYELTYDSQGLIKGVNSGSSPITVAGQDGFEREVYLGTCSRNVCKPDLGVKTVSVVLEFTAIEGSKSQFSKEFEL